MTRPRTTVGASVRGPTSAVSVSAVEPTPIYADLVSADRVRPASHGSPGAGRSVTDILRALRDEAPGAAPVPGVGRVPGLLTFPPRSGPE